VKVNEFCVHYERHARSCAIQRTEQRDRELESVDNPRGILEGRKASFELLGRDDRSLRRLLTTETDQSADDVTDT